MALGKGWRGSAAVTPHTKIAEGVFAEGFFAEGLSLPRAWPSAKASLPRAFIAEGLSWRPSAKKVFAECPRFSPRQSLGPRQKTSFQ